MNDWHNERRSPKDSPWKLEQHSHRNVLSLHSPRRNLVPGDYQDPNALAGGLDNGCFYSGTRLVVYRREANEILPDSITFLFDVINISYAERQLFMLEIKFLYFFCT